MRIAALSEDLPVLLDYFGLLPAITATSDGKVPGNVPPVAAIGRLEIRPPTINFDAVNIKKVQEVNPSHLVGFIRDPKVTAAEIKEFERSLAERIALPETLVRIFQLSTFDSLLSMFADIAVYLGQGQRGRELAQRAKAQLMDLCNNFYPRMKNRKIAVLSSVQPMKLAGLWIPDLVKQAAAIPMHPYSGYPDRAITWDELCEFNPDVIVVAPRGVSVEESRKLFLEMEKLPRWNEVRAVMRGDVYFCEGQSQFYYPTPAIIPSICTLISTIASLESGYITPRDSFFKLRWLEVQRHRL